MKNMIKYASLLLAAVMLFSCHGYYDPNDPAYGGGGEKDDAYAELKISSDRNLIQTFGGDHANITVTLGKKVITEDVIFFDGKNKVVDLPDFKFYASEPGEYELWANYGTYNSARISIKAISIEIPETPADPKPSSTSFKSRALITEFTTTGCSWCPSMKNVLHSALENEAAADRVVMTACHSSLVNSVKDPAYIKTGYEDFSGATGLPFVFCDMYYGFGYYNGLSGNDLVGLFDELCAEKEDVAAGIAVTSSLKDGQLVAKVTVKAAQTGSYRIGAFLLEDGIYGKQTSATADWMHNHDNVIRHIDSRYYSNAGREQFYGHSVGEVEAGKTADYVFVWLLDEIWEKGALNGEMYGGYYWDPFVEENLHLAVFVSSVTTDDRGSQYYYVNNAIDCPVNGQTPYEYR